MRVLALQMLAICQLACASPCKPSSSASVTLSTTSAESTSAPAVSSSTIADETETSTTFFTGSTAVSETETATTETETETVSGTTTEVASDSATSTILITTSSAEPTTLATSAAEPTTTTTAAPEPTNVLTNPGFDSGTITSWYTIGQRGTLSLSDDPTHAGEFSGHFYADYNGPVVLGVDHPVDQSLIKVDTEYHYSIWIKTTTAVDCQTRKITCGAGGGYILGTDWAGPYNEWTQFTMSCIWNQNFLDLVPSIQIRAECQSLEFYVDDAILIEAN
ncbi:hypothetical protein NW765_016066 [Fusarium oxysporum]|nr:hypothetical protein FOWG_08364 [Fusarium oxysporum f. sp. lycopersici MN25]KAJ4127587.1 hypothetical protein NW765_016066 [Fusarium oxysporum]KAJ4280961.1 hypothetical protein NW764_005306 [Fusarium oxysporum]